MAEADTLAYFDKRASTKVIADATPIGLGAELMPICNAGRIVSQGILQDGERGPFPRLGTWQVPRIYLWNAIWSGDRSQPLEAIYGPRSKPCERIERWVIHLQPYDVRVVYAPGQSNVANPLSRLLSQNELTKNQHGAEEYVRFVAISATPAALTTREVEASAVNEELKALRDGIKNGRFEKCKVYAPAAGELCVIGQSIVP